MHVNIITALPTKDGKLTTRIEAIAVTLERKKDGYVLQLGLRGVGAETVDAGSIQFVHHIPLGGALDQALTQEVSIALVKQRLEVEIEK